MLNILALLLSRIVPPSSLSPSAFKALYDAHVGLVIYVLRQFNLPQQDLEDIVQEVFFKAFQTELIDHPDKLKAFLTTIARNKALDLLRKKKRQKTDLAGDTLDDDHPQAWDQDFRRVQEAEAVVEFLEEIQHEPGAEVLIQFYKEGLSVREIAAKRQEAISSVTSRLSRARTRFKEHLRIRLDALVGEG